MGYERKRGKLADLNALLRGSGRERFSLIVGDVATLSGVKYVITLDTDTQLPLDAGRQCVATMAHPLNRPQYDETRQRVIRGYGILQPRMGASLSGTQRSLYARLFGSEPGIDPYTRTVSDVYQDLFGEGSFIGKGIYDVDAFERALGARFPENRILSHDLLEGCYARSGLLSDVHLYEDYPSRYDADARRQERWIRGDWQIARWLLPRVPGPAKLKPAKPAVPAFAVEDPGQPAAQPRAGGVAAAAAVRMVQRAGRRLVDARRRERRPDPAVVDRHRRRAAPARGRSPDPAPDGGAALGRTKPRAGRVPDCLSAA